MTQTKVKNRMGPLVVMPTDRDTYQIIDLSNMVTVSPPFTTRKAAENKLATIKQGSKSEVQ